MGVLALVLGLLTVDRRRPALARLCVCLSVRLAPRRSMRRCGRPSSRSWSATSDLPNAVALNSTSFNAARMIGPAVAGRPDRHGRHGLGVPDQRALVRRGAGLAVSAPRRRAAAEARGPAADPGGFMEGFRYVWGRPDLKAIMVMLFLIGTFGLNFPIFISTMAVNVFHAGASGFGLLSSDHGGRHDHGSAAGRWPRQAAIQVADGRRGCLRSRLHAGRAVCPATGCSAGSLVLIGVAALTLTNTTNSLMQLSTEPAMRGRVMALRLAIALGGTPIGAPIVGWVADHFGPRWALGVGCAAGFAAAVVGIYYLIKYCHLDIHMEAGRLRVSFDDPLGIK